MEQMSITAPFFVLIELLRPFGFLLGFILLAEFVLIAIAVYRRPWRSRRALKAAAVLGLAGGILTALLALPLTDAGLRDLQNVLDYTAYLVIVLGVGAAIFIVSLPPLLLWSVERVALEPAPQVR
jgi:hypothetical protein